MLSKLRSKFDMKSPLSSSPPSSPIGAEGLPAFFGSSFGKGRRPGLARGFGGCGLAAPVLCVMSKLLFVTSSSIDASSAPPTDAGEDTDGGGDIGSVASIDAIASAFATAFGGDGGGGGVSFGKLPVTDDCMTLGGGGEADVD